MSDKNKRYIDAVALQAQLERKKAGIANKRYIEGWNDCMARVKSMVSTAPRVDLGGGQGYVKEIGYMPQYTPGNGGKGYVTELVAVRKHEDICT